MAKKLHKRVGVVKEKKVASKDPEYRLTNSWDDENRKLFFNSLADDRGLKNKSDWYQITKADVNNFGGGMMLKTFYAGSVSKALEDLYPEHEWLTWKFNDPAPSKTWNNTQLQKEFMNYFAKELKMKKMEDWYAVTGAQICEKGGSGLIDKFQNSPSNMIMSVLPEHSWDLRKFNRKSIDTWGDMSSQRNLMSQLTRDLNIKQIEDWYNVTNAQISEKGGGGLLSGRYQSSPSKMIMSILADHDWDPQKFKSRPKRTWNEMKSQQDFLNEMAKELKIVKMEEWYGVSAAQIREKGGGALLSERYQGSPSKLIMSILTDHRWDPEKFNNKGKRK